jgi:hypothetical protein
LLTALPVAGILAPVLSAHPFWQVILLGILLIYVVGQENILRGVRAFFGRKKAARPGER